MSCPEGVLVGPGGTLPGVGVSLSTGVAVGRVMMVGLTVGVFGGCCTGVGVGCVMMIGLTVGVFVGCGSGNVRVGVASSTVGVCVGNAGIVFCAVGACTGIVFFTVGVGVRVGSGPDDSKSAAISVSACDTASIATRITTWTGAGTSTSTAFKTSLECESSNWTAGSNAFALAGFSLIKVSKALVTCASSF